METHRFVGGWVSDAVKEPPEGLAEKFESTVGATYRASPGTGLVGFARASKDCKLEGSRVGQQSECRKSLNGSNGRQRFGTW